MAGSPAQIAEGALLSLSPVDLFDAESAQPIEESGWQWVLVFPNGRDQHCCAGELRYDDPRELALFVEHWKQRVLGRDVHSQPTHYSGTEGAAGWVNELEVRSNRGSNRGHHLRADKRY